METSQLLKKVLKKDTLSTEDIVFLLGKVDVAIRCSDCKVLFYKSVERALVHHYEEAYGVCIPSRVYNINEIHGLILFLHIKKYGYPEVDVDLERFFENLFFSGIGEMEVKQLKEENERLTKENEELRERINEMNNAWIDRGFEEGEFRSVDEDVLSRMERDLAALREQVDFEHPLILEAWYRLGEEYIKGRH
ncbi:karyopherin subunit alpha-5 [Encephalitozoon hellem]|uniref:Karyopherin subunit alpha-5 n=1 Tax=Encephalitozoon hellem TaxID=27973 RepID=A0A9Q9C1W7_ENCHE|nr:karyopherin subunit alpha-5 [Encephalitozoon hellem]